MESRSGLRDLWSTSGLDRTAAFSDAVLAIAMTILVLDLKAPDVAGRREYDAALLAALPQFYGFALSFGLLCLLWMAHHARLSALKRIDAGLLGWNCAMLFFAALTPLPTSMLFGRSYGSPVPPVFYALVMSCTWLCLNGMWRHAWRAGLMADDVSARTYRGALLSTLPTTAVFLISVPFAFIPGFASWTPLLWVLALPVNVVVERLVGAGRDSRIPETGADDG